MNEIIHQTLWKYTFNLFLIYKGTKDFISLTSFFICSLKAFPKGEYENLPFSIICLWLEDSISSPVRYSYLSIFPNDNADIFAAS